MSSRKPGFRSQAHRGNDRWLVLGVVVFIAALTLISYLIGGPRY
jgi:hypothetical protein